MAYRLNEGTTRITGCTIHFVFQLDGISKRTERSHDTEVLWGGINEKSAIQEGNARDGGQAGENVTYRVYGAQLEDDRGFLPGAPQAPDGRTAAIGCARLDWTPSNQDTITLQGDYLVATQGFDDINGATGFPVQSFDGNTANIVTRWVQSGCCGGLNLI